VANARWRTLLLGLGAGLLAAAVAFVCSKAIPREAFLSTHDVWFEGDLRRVFANMVDRNSDHYRSKVHPLFSLVAYAMVWVPRRLLAMDAVLSVRIVGAVVAFVWGFLLYRLLHTITRNAIAAFLLTCTALASASFLFWGTVPETYLFGSASILFALLVTLKASELRVMGAVAATLAFTVTNVMAGLAAAIITLPWRRALQAAANALCIVVLLWGVQKYAIPSTQFFIGDKEEKDYMFRLDADRVSSVARSFFVTSMVMPTPTRETRYYQPEAILFTQHAPVSGWAALIAWLALLLLGMAGLRDAADIRPLRLALLLTLAGQFALHVVYGEETFLYSLHFMPLLILLAAFAFRTRFRAIAFGLAGALLLTAALNNVQQFNDARTYAAKPAGGHAPQR
jgi:hypothetical protein